MKPLVIYHANCNDGFGAAYAAWTKFGDEAEYVPMNYGDTLNSDFHHRDVYVLDFSFPPDFTKELIQYSRHFTWLDHHKTAFENWAGDEREFYIDETEYTCIILDNNRSGAMLTWDYFNPHLETPELIQHIDDRDRWQFKLPGTRELHAGLEQYKYDFKLWNELAMGSLETSFQFELLEDIKREGKILLSAQDARVQSVVSRELKEVTLYSKIDPLGKTIVENPMICFTTVGLAANVVNDISEIGNAIAQRSGTFSMTFFIKGDEVICSLRSIAPFDVSVIAKYYGGGGHAQAAGFKMGIQRFFSEIWK